MSFNSTPTPQLLHNFFQLLEDGVNQIFFRMAAYQNLKILMDPIQPNPAMGQPNACTTLCHCRT